MWYNVGMKKYFLVILLALVPGFFLQITIHEGSHAVVGVAQGLQLHTFTPYPHTTEDGRKHFGRTSFAVPPTYKPTHFKLAMLYVAPFITGIALFSILLLLRLLALKHRWVTNDWLGGLFTLSVFLPAIDTFWGLLHSFRFVLTSDIWKLFGLLQLPMIYGQIICVIFGIVIVLAAATILYYEVINRWEQ